MRFRGNQSLNIFQTQLRLKSKNMHLFELYTSTAKHAPNRSLSGWITQSTRPITAIPHSHRKMIHIRKEEESSAQGTLTGLGWYGAPAAMAILEHIAPQPLVFLRWPQALPVLWLLPVALLATHVVRCPDWEDSDRCGRQKGAVGAFEVWKMSVFCSGVWNRQRRVFKGQMPLKLRGVAVVCYSFLLMKLRSCHRVWKVAVKWRFCSDVGSHTVHMSWASWLLMARLITQAQLWTTVFVKVWVVLWKQMHFHGFSH